MPCFKLTIRFDREDMAQRFLLSQRSGFYFGVEQEGTVEAGDRFKLLGSDPQGLKVADVVRLRTTDRENTELLLKAVATAALGILLLVGISQGTSLQQYFLKRYYFHFEAAERALPFE